MMRSYKYRLIPNREQEKMLAKHFGSVRYLYNWGLEQKTKAYQCGEKTPSRFELDKQTTQLKNELTWLREINSQSLQAALRNLESAYTKFFREKRGFPRFKSKKDRHHSFEYPQGAKVDFNSETIHLPKIGKVKFKASRVFDGLIKKITVSKTPTGKVFVSVLVDTLVGPPEKPSIDIASAVGIDVGLKNFCTLSTGEKISHPKYLRVALRKLRRMSRSLSRKKKGSRNRNKSRDSLARQYEKINNKRSDFLNKLSTRIVRENQTVCVENLNISGLMKNGRLSRAILDSAWGTFISMLEYKCEWNGKNFLRIGRFEPSSKMCTCGIVNNALTLSQRRWTCSECGETHDRDVLAANNIVRFSLVKQNLVGMGSAECKPSEIDLRLIGDLGIATL